MQLQRQLDTGKQDLRQLQTQMAALWRQRDALQQWCESLEAQALKAGMTPVPPAENLGPRDE